MKFNGLVISGIKGSGKTSALQEIIKINNDFSLVKAKTTRKPRKDDFEGQYDYLGKEEFEKLDYIVKTSYQNESYGIALSDLEEVISKGKYPILVITPESYYTSFIEKNTKFHFLSFFLDGNDEIIKNRIHSRDDDKNYSIIENQRKIDRAFAKYFIYNLNTTNEPTVSELCEVILLLWENREKSGILTKSLITKLLPFDCLLSNASKDYVSGASYDLCLGEEFYCKGKIKRLGKFSPFILIEPYDYAIVTSQENVNFPLDIVGRFDIKVQLFCQGVILSNGPQIDPGFKGKLFCLLFNTSNSPVVLKKGEHYATIEFHKTLEPTNSYSGKYQDKDSIIHYLPSNTLQGGVSELKKEIEKLSKESRSTQNTFYAIISLVLAILAILLSLR